MSDLPRSRATVVQALIDQLKRLPARVEWLGGQRTSYVQRDSVMAIADDLAALLLREGPPQDYGPDPNCKDCKGSGECPNAQFRCACRWKPRAGLREGQEPPAVADEEFVRHQFTAISSGESDNDGEMWCSDCEYHRDHEIHTPAGLREGPPAPHWLLKKLRFALDEARKTITVDHPVRLHVEGAMVDIDFYETMQANTDEELTDPPAPPGHAGEAPQEGVPDHCENCRAEMPLTTVHLCHACLPSAPRDHAGWLRGMASDIVLYVRKGAWHTTEVEQTLRYLVTRWPFHALAASQAVTALDYKARYFELIYAVGNKYAGESRHETALRYIRKAEEPNGQAAAAAHGAVPPQEP